jgi:hypothetical protein
MAYACCAASALGTGRPVCCKYCSTSSAQCKVRSNRRTHTSVFHRAAYLSTIILATIPRFYMTRQTMLSDEEMVQWHGHSCLCAFAAPMIQGMSTTVALPDTEILIANPELEFELTCRKQSPLEIPNRECFAIFSLTFLLFSASTTAQPSNSKIDLFATCLNSGFSPRKRVSRDMIRPLAPLK